MWLRLFIHCARTRLIRTGWLQWMSHVQQNLISAPRTHTMWDDSVPWAHVVLQTHGNEHIWLSHSWSFGFYGFKRNFLYSTETEGQTDRFVAKGSTTWPNIKTFSTPHYVFSLRWLVQVVFSRLNCHHFFFFRFNYHSDFYDSLKSLYVHQMIENHLIDDWNFLICLSVYSYISSLYAYISIFVSFYDSFSCLNASVHAVLIIIRSINLLNLILRMY